MSCDHSATPNLGENILTFGEKYLFHTVMTQCLGRHSGRMKLLEVRNTHVPAIRNHLQAQNPQLKLSQVDVYTM